MCQIQYHFIPRRPESLISTFGLPGRATELASVTHIVSMDAHVHYSKNVKKQASCIDLKDVYPLPTLELLCSQPLFLSLTMEIFCIVKLSHQQ